MSIIWNKLNQRRKKMMKIWIFCMNIIAALIVNIFMPYYYGVLLFCILCLIEAIFSIDAAKTRSTDDISRIKIPPLLNRYNGT